MANYDKNFLTMMGGHLNIYGDNGEVKIGSGIAQPRTGLDNTADIRDILANIVGNGYKGLSDNSIKADYARLANIVGITQAQKLVDHAIVYNQRSDVIGKPLEARIQGFYSMGSQDKNINNILQNAGKFGDGPIAGLNRSNARTNMDLTGTDVVGELGSANEEIKNLANKKIK